MHFLLFTVVNLIFFFHELGFIYYECKLTKNFTGSKPVFTATILGFYIFLRATHSLSCLKIIKIDEGSIILPLLILLQVKIRLRGVFL